MKNFTFIAALVSGLLCCVFIYLAMQGDDSNLVGAMFCAIVFVVEMCIYLKIDSNEYYS